MLKKITFAFAAILFTASLVKAQDDLHTPEIITIKNGSTLRETLSFDTIEVVDPVTDEIVFRHETHARIGTLNGNYIYKKQQVKKLPRKFLQGDILNVLDRKLRDDINDAKNFFGQIELVIDTEGNIVYSKISLHDTALFGKLSAPVNKQLSESIKSGITQKLSKMHFKPAIKDGQPVPYYAVLY